MIFVNWNFFKLLYFVFKLLIVKRYCLICNYVFKLYRLYLYKYVLEYKVSNCIIILKVLYVCMYIMYV